MVLCGKSIYCDGPVHAKTSSTSSTMPHFIGNILQDKRAADLHPESHDKSFHYSARDKHELINQLPSLPIRFEHSETLGDVGRVKSAWQSKDGRVWVVGEISDTGIAGKFVNKTIASQQHVGLSLGHEHTEYSDGSTRKRGLEVSICKQPRRPGCGVAVSVHASSRHYKRAAADATTTNSDTTSNMSETTDSTPTQSDASPPTTANASAPNSNTDDSTQRETSNTEVDSVPPKLPPAPELAAQVMQFAEQARAAEARVAELEQERNKRIEAEKQQQEKENAERKLNAENLAKSVLEHVAQFQAGNGQNASPQSCADQERAIKSLMESHPREVETVLQVAHLCSSRAAKLEAELKQEKLQAEQMQLRSQYHAAVQQATGVNSSHAASTHDATTIDVRASKRQRTSTSHSSLLPKASSKPRSRYEHLGIDCNDVTSAYQQFAGMSGGNGATVSRMNEIAGIMKRQQKRGFC